MSTDSLKQERENGMELAGFNHQERPPHCTDSWVVHYGYIVWALASDEALSLTARTRQTAFVFLLHCPLPSILAYICLFVHIYILMFEDMTSLLYCCFRLCGEGRW